jgi:hypothetical protein
MKTYHKLLVIALVAAMIPVLAPTASAQMLEDRIRVTFSAPVEVPGKVLPAGTYIFEALEPGHLTRILSADETRVYGTFLTLPDEREDSAEDVTVFFKESPKGSPERVQAWFSPGDTLGNEFIYEHASSHGHLAGIIGASTRMTGHELKESAVLMERGSADAVKGVAMSTEFVGKHAERVGVNSALAIGRAAKYLVS